jgi:hypothetical protein
MNKEKPKIFLSYAREDMGMAKQFYNDLNRYGLDVWLDTESLLPGDRWKDKMQEAIEKCNYFIALLSTQSMNKWGFVQKELKIALEVLDLFPDSERLILPVRLDDCEISERKLKEPHCIDMFPDSEYQNGLKKILQGVGPGTFLLRSKPMQLSAFDVNEMIVRHGFYEANQNPGGRGASHQYKLQVIDGDKVIFDEASSLMWQQSGSDERMEFRYAKKYINELNETQFAGFNDWRLPTLEESISLVEPERHKGLHINIVFERRQSWIWTADQNQLLGSLLQWVVNFIKGYSYFYLLDYGQNYVRAVRFCQEHQK